MSKFGLLFLAVLAYTSYLLIASGPVVGLYFYQLVYFLRPDHRWWGAGIPDISYSFLIVVMTMTVFFLQYKKINKGSILKIPEFVIVCFIILLYVVISLFAVNPVIHNLFLTDLIKQFFILYLAIKLIDDRKKLKIALMSYVVGGAYIGWEAYRVGRNAFGRVEGIGMVDVPDANGTASCLVSAAPILIYFFWRLDWKWKIGVAILGGVIANGLVLINSRGAFLGVLAGAGYLFAHMMFSRYKLPKQKLMVTLILTCSAFAVIKVTDDAFWERMSTIKSTASKDSEASGGKRINYWLATFDMLEDYPLGLGIYGFQTVSTLYLKDERFFDTHKHEGTKVRAVHSLWFQALSEIGWIGLALFLWLLLKIWSRLKKTKDALIERGMLQDYYFVVSVQAALFGFLVAGSFIDAFRQVVFYWLIGYCIIVNVIYANILNEIAEEPELKSEGVD